MGQRDAYSGIYVKKVVVLIAILLSFTAGLFLLQNSSKSSTSTIKIAVSTFALYDIVKHVGGEKVEVEMVIPFGVEVHSFEPTPKTIIKIQKSALFLYSGASLEPWIKKLAKTSNMIDMSHYVKLKAVSEGEDEDEEEHHHHHHGLNDPHYWLDIENMKRLTTAVLSQLQKIDPENSSYYEKNAQQYTEELTLLQEAYQKTLATCELHEVVLQHNILGYLAPKYGFRVSALSGLSPEALTNAKTMAKVSDRVHQKGIQVLFFESFVSDRLIQNLAKENGVEVDYLEPLANITAEQAKHNMSYVEGMRSNLEKLSRAMKCH